MREFTPLPEEFPSRSSEVVPPGQEFGQSGYPSAPSGKKGLRGALKTLLLTGAAVLTGWSLLGGTVPDAASEAIPEDMAQVVEEVVASPTPETAPSSSPAVTPGATPSVTASPTPSPSPTPDPHPQPGFESVFFAFSHEHQGAVYLYHPEHIQSVTVEIRDTVRDAREFYAELTRQEIDSGRYELPTLSAGDIFMDNLDFYMTSSWPELALTVTAVLDDGSADTKTVTAAEELGWYAQYRPENDGENDYTHPNCFVFATYESPGSIPRIVLGGEEAAEDGAIAVMITVNGRVITSEECEISSFEEPGYTLDDNGNYVELDQSYGYAQLLVPRPADVPEHGTAHFTVVQKLETYGILWTTEKDVEY